MFKIWLTLKKMGMTAETPIEITTSSPTPALNDLFSYGNPSGNFFIPFAHTSRFKTMQGDAARSIIQTTIRRWCTSGSVVGADPTAYLHMQELPSGALQVQPTRYYPQGLGFGKNGFALEDDARVNIPDLAFAVWYYRGQDIPAEGLTRESLRHRLAFDLSLTPAEMELVLVADEAWKPSVQDEALTAKELYGVVTEYLTQPTAQPLIVHETFEKYTTKVRSMVTIADGPGWLTSDPFKRLQDLVKTGAKAILLYGPPRTSKTYAVDLVCPRVSAERETIQIHNGWGYDELMLGFKPQGDTWDYLPGPLLGAVLAAKKCIVLEEINRTEFSQAIGEVFSLLEEAYRGEKNRIKLKNDEYFFIPEDTLVICTMNTLDRSTEEVDDALFGRMAAVEFPPRVEDLQNILETNSISPEVAQKLRELFSTIQRSYPLGHGYFAGYKQNTLPVEYYMTRIRPVLQKHLQNYRDDELKSIDEKVNLLFKS